MKKEIYMCDICGEEAGSPRTGDDVARQVIFLTEQNEGRSAKPYFEYVKFDWCEQCRYKALLGYAIYAEGAMGHNKYFFKKP